MIAATGSEGTVNSPGVPSEVPGSEVSGSEVLVAGPPARGPVPSGRAVRALTSRAARTRTGAGWGALLSDVYTFVLSLAIGLSISISAAERLGEAWRPPPGTASGPVVIDPEWLAALAALALVGGLLSIASRLGPVSLGAPQAAWWLPMPVDRRTLLRPSALRLPLGTAAAGGLASAVLAVLALPERDVSHVLRVAATSALVSALVALLAGLAQTAGVTRRVVTSIGDGAVAAAPVLAVVIAVSGPTAPADVTVPLIVLVTGAGLVAAAAVLLDRRLPRIRDRDIRERGAVAGRALTAAVSLDSRELGSALSDASRRQRRSRSLGLGVVRGPATALITSDWLLLARSPRHLLQVAVAACLPIAVVLSGTPSAALLAPMLLVGGYAASLATAEGARRAEVAPVLDRILPLGADVARRLRAVVPGAVMAVWTLVVFGVLAVRRDDVAWLVLGLLATPVWAGAAVRAAYRPRPDWSGALVATPAGALPPGAAGVLARGVDATVLGMVPVIVALVIGAVPPAMVALQVFASLVVFWVGTRLPAAGPRPALARRRPGSSRAAPAGARFACRPRAPGPRASGCARHSSLASSTLEWSTARACSISTRAPVRWASRPPAGARPGWSSWTPHARRPACAGTTPSRWGSPTGWRW